MIKNSRLSKDEMKKLRILELGARVAIKEDIKLLKELAKH